jgi:hypothetical protein
MVIRAVAIIFCFFMLCGIAWAENTQRLTIETVTGAATATTTAPVRTISLQEAAATTKNTTQSINSTIPEPAIATVTQSVDSSSVGSGMVSDGINQFGKSLINGMYASFDNNSAVNNQFGSPRGALYTVITYVPNPYQDPNIESLFKNYNALAIFFVIIFIFGEWANRNLAIMKVNSSVFGEKDLSTSKFFGGLAMCGIALFANFIYMYSLQIIQALSQFAMSNVLDSIAPSPDNLILYFMMALCDLTVFIFFVIRYFIIYAVAVLCTIIAVLLVPDFSRDFAKKSIDHIVRILLLQPVAIFFTCLGILTMKGLPSQLQPVGYIGLTIFIFLVCIYMLIGDFEFIKKGAKTVIAWGMAV